MTDLHKEIDTTARTIWAEARGEGHAGMIAVADVIANRVAAAQVYIEEHGHHHPLFGDGTFADCCTRPWQFSCWNENDPNRAKLLAVTDADTHFADAFQIAGQAVDGALQDSTQAATYYYAKSMHTPPKWATGLTPCAEIGNQLFFNNVK